MDKWEEAKVNKHSTRVWWSDKSMIAEYHRSIWAIELLIEFLEEGETVSSDFHGINRGLSVEPVANSVVVEFVGLSC